jgi:hypothetical protein
MRSEGIGVGGVSTTEPLSSSEVQVHRQTSLRLRTPKQRSMQTLNTAVSYFLSVTKLRHLPPHHPQGRSHLDQFILLLESSCSVLTEQRVLRLEHALGEIDTMIA